MTSDRVSDRDALRLSELIGMEIVSASGRHVGQVADLRCAGDPEVGGHRTPRVVNEIIYGRVGWIERLGFVAVRKKALPWSDVAEIHEGRLVLRRELDPKE